MPAVMFGAEDIMMNKIVIVLVLSESSEVPDKGTGISNSV